MDNFITAELIIECFSNYGYLLKTDNISNHFQLKTLGNKTKFHNSITITHNFYFINTNCSKMYITYDRSDFYKSWDSLDYQYKPTLKIQYNNNLVGILNKHNYIEVINNNNNIKEILNIGLKKIGLLTKDEAMIKDIIE